MFGVWLPWGGAFNGYFVNKKKRKTKKCIVLKTTRTFIKFTQLDNNKRSELGVNGSFVFLQGFHYDLVCFLFINKLLPSNLF